MKKTKTNTARWLSRLAPQFRMICVIVLAGLIGFSMVSCVLLEEEGKKGAGESNMKWTKVTDGSQIRTNGLAFGNGTFVAVGFWSSAAYSTTGETWTKVVDYLPLPSGLAHLYAIAYGNGKFVTGSGSHMAYSSDNGKTWTQTEEIEGFGSDTSSVNAIAYGNGMFVAGNNSGGKIAYSSDGVNWTIASNSTFTEGYVGAIVYGGDKFVAVGGWDKAQIAYSYDGINWTAVADTKIDTGIIGAVAYGDGIFVAGSKSNGKTAYSSDGITWKAGKDAILSDEGQSLSISTIAYGNGTFVAGSGSGRMAVSTDGVKWKNVKDSTFDKTYGDGINAIAYGNGRFVAGGEDGGYDGQVAYSIDE